LQRNPSPAQQNPNAFSFRESRFLNGLTVDSGRLEDDAIGPGGRRRLPVDPLASFLKN
jgi:hypothetical protein